MTPMWVAAAGDTLAIAGSDGVLLWRRREGGIAAKIDGPGDALRCAFAADGRLVVGWRSGRVSIHRGADLDAEIDTGHPAMPGLALAADRFATGGSDGKTRVWSLATLDKILEVGDPTHATSAVAWSRARLVVGRSTGYFLAYDEQQTVIAEGGVFNGAAVYSIGVHPAGIGVVFGGEKGFMVAVSSDVEWRSLETIKEPRRPIAVNSIAFSPDGARFVAACSDDTAKLYEWKNRRLAATLGSEFWVRTPRPEWNPSFIVSSACFDPSADVIYTTHHDGTLRAWHPSEFRPLVAVELDGDGAATRWRDAMAAYLG